MRSLLAGVAVLLTAVAFAAQDPAARAPAQAAAKGRLLAVGGGGTTDAIVARAIELAGGVEKRMLIVPQASGAEDAGKGSLEFWREHGMKNVAVLELGDRDDALAAIRAADFVWMPGGDQSRLMKALQDADLVTAIRERYLTGALVGGTSAGAAVLSAAMIVGGDTADLKSVRAGGTLTAEGLGLWPEAVVDQHFAQRQRFNRLFACVLDLPQLVGVGIDEKTAVIRHPDGACEVVGDSLVTVVDARRATRRPAGTGELHSADGLSLSVLRAGDRFSLAPPDQR
jgi:cyanophycinase